MGKNNKKSAKQQEQKRADRIRRAKEMVWPTAPNQFGRTCLSMSDLSSQFTKQLAPYNTIGSQNFFWRAAYESGDIVQQSNGDFQGTQYFMLSSFPGYTDYTAVFDQYRLRAITVQISPRNDISASTMNMPCRLYTAIDYDDAATVTRSQILQYDTCIESPVNSGIVRCIVPRMAVAAYSGTFTSYANVKDQWIDIASTNVQHYGLKVVIESGNGVATGLQSYTVNIEGFLEFRAAR